jgi:hypothetical protein
MRRLRMDACTDRGRWLHYSGDLSRMAPGQVIEIIVLTVVPQSPFALFTLWRLDVRGYRLSYPRLACSRSRLTLRVRSFLKLSICVNGIRSKVYTGNCRGTAPKLRLNAAREVVPDHPML